MALSCTGSVHGRQGTILHREAPRTLHVDSVTEGLGKEGKRWGWRLAWAYTHREPLE